MTCSCLIGRLSSMSSIWPAVETTICQYLGLRSAIPYTTISSATTLQSPEIAARPLTTASDISAVSLASIFTLPPMKTKDVNLVFSNIQNLASFSDEFLDQLESAMGELIEGNVGEDHIGRLFLDSVRVCNTLFFEHSDHFNLKRLSTKFACLCGCSLSDPGQ